MSFGPELIVLQKTPSILGKFWVQASQVFSIYWYCMQDLQ